MTHFRLLLIFGSLMATWAAQSENHCEHLEDLPHHVQSTQWDCLSQEPDCHDKCVFRKLQVLDESDWPKPWEVAKEFAGGNFSVRFFNSAWRAFQACLPPEEERRSRRSSCQDILSLVLCAWQRMYKECGNMY